MPGANSTQHTDRADGHPLQRSRRFFTISAALAGLSLLAGCSMSDNDDSAAPTETPEPTETPAPEPTATQQIIGSPVPGYGDPGRWTGRVVTVASWGGDYQDAQKSAFFDPFALATGATVQEKVADISELRSQVESQNVLWDVLTLPMAQVVRLGREGYLTPLSYDVIDTTALYPDIVQEYGVGASYFSTVLTYPAGSKAAPASWADFWSIPPVVEGEETDESETLRQRSLRRSPIGTLEFALLADDVPVDSLYPLDADRAFASLDRIREQVLVWWQESKEPIELVAAGQVGMASAYNPRVHQLELSDSVRILWYQGMLSADAWVVPAGAQNLDVAMDFISFATRAIPTANFSRLVPYGPVNTEAFDFLRRDRHELLPSSPTNKAVQFVENWEFWAENLDPLTERFEAWLLEIVPEATPSATDS